MLRIYKYDLKTTSEQTIGLPVGAKVLSAINQRGSIVLYALVDDDLATPTAVYRVSIRGTGHLAESVKDTPFVGTVSLLNGELILHVFGKFCEEEAQC